MATKTVAKEETSFVPADYASEKKVKIKLPIMRDSDGNIVGDMFVSVNDRNWLIKRGCEVEVPECVYEVLKNKEAQEEANILFEEEIRNAKNAVKE